MQLSLKGIHVDIGTAFRTHVEDSLAALHEKYHLEPIEVKVQLSKEAHQFRTDITSHMARGVVMRGHGLGPEAHASFEDAIHHLIIRLTRHKGRLLAHQQHHGSRREKQVVPYYILSTEAATKPNSQDLAPPIIAEMEAEIPTLTVSEAVMRLDLSQEPAMMFHNLAHEGLNMVYRRSDGNIGWVDPKNGKK